MKKMLRVFGWTSFRREASATPGGKYQTREIVAAKSWAEVARLSEISLHHLKTYGSETGNEEELRVALESPGVIFWTPLDRRHSNEPKAWTAVPKKTE